MVLSQRANGGHEVSTNCSKSSDESTQPQSLVPSGRPGKDLPKLPGTRCDRVPCWTNTSESTLPATGELEFLFGLLGVCADL